MATVKLDIVPDVDRELSDTLLELVRGLDITFDETGILEPESCFEIEFGGPIGDLEILLNRYNEDHGIDAFGELLKLIKE